MLLSFSAMCFDYCIDCLIIFLVLGVDALNCFFLR